MKFKKPIVVLIILLLIAGCVTIYQAKDNARITTDKESTYEGGKLGVDVNEKDTIQ